MSSRRVPTLLLGAAAGCLVADIYYAQPVVATIAQDLHLSNEVAALLVTALQVAYAAGLLFLAPLGDIVENRKLIVVTTAVLCVATALAAVAPNAALFALACFCIGFSAVVVQMIVPLAAHLADPQRRGAVVGSVMSGLVLGIVLGRPLSSAVTYYFGWRWIFAIGAVLAAFFAVALGRRLEKRPPDTGLSYRKLVGSLWPIFRSTPVLQRRALYQAMLFGAFSLFWTAAPLELQLPPMRCTQLAIALFGFAGAAGAAAAPVAGRLADRGHTRAGTAVAMLAVALAFGIAWAGGETKSFAAFVVAGIVLDLGVQANLVFGQRSIYSLDAERRSRLNSIYMGLFFTGGACGSALAGVLVAHAGWTVTCAAGAGAALFALVALATERREEEAPHAVTVS